MALVKRSLSLNGHRTSVALEPEFWSVLDAAARGSGQSTEHLVAQVDRDRGETPLASSLRVYALTAQRNSLPE
ncbi:MAG: ribbon-helix-helix domain-containing protein [Rhodobiaceae bacterium]|nr:ribbon-helix-helix domain-containing protein [Rhodobiaceae bacterium]